MKRFAVFDIDGTLIRWQLYHAIVGKLAAANHLGASAQKELKAARMAWKQRANADSFRSYEKLLVKIFEDAFTHLKTDDFDKFVTEIIDEYKDQTYVYTRRLLATLKKQDYTLFIISGSHTELISQISEYYGFDDYRASSYERENGSFTGKKHIPSFDKAKALKDLIQEHGVSAEGSVGIGDSGSDIAMLELVEQPIAFNPDQTLLTAAQTAGWPVVVERKNVIYRLEPRNGSYLLAETIEG